jgi:uncharacterized protein YqiB (DUF1249 family)
MDNSKAIFKKLLQVIPNLKGIESYAKLSASGFMDLHVDILYKNGKQRLISLAHNYRAGGDSIPDPDMEITVDFEGESASAETYQDTYSYQVADSEKARNDLNDFLVMWLNNLIDQGHKIVNQCAIST